MEEKLSPFEETKIVKEIRKIDNLEERIKELKKQIQQVKDNIRDNSNEYKNELTNDLICYIKYSLEFPVSYLGITGSVKAQLKTTCMKCGKEMYIKINSKDDYDRIIRDLDFHRICENCQAKKEEESEKKFRMRKEQLYLLKTMPYKEYLQTEHWQEFRRKVLKRYNNKCQLCGKTGKLNVHHNNYDHRGEEDYKDVLLLCEDCHHKFHNKEVIKNE